MYVAWEQVKNEKGEKGVYIVVYPLEIPKDLVRLQCYPLADTFEDIWEYKYTKKRFKPEGRL